MKNKSDKDTKIIDIKLYIKGDKFNVPKGTSLRALLIAIKNNKQDNFSEQINQFSISSIIFNELNFRSGNVNVIKKILDEFVNCKNITFNNCQAKSKIKISLSGHINVTNLLFVNTNTEKKEIITSNLTNFISVAIEIFPNAKTVTIDGYAINDEFNKIFKFYPKSKLSKIILINNCLNECSEPAGDNANTIKDNIYHISHCPTNKYLDIVEVLTRGNNFKTNFPTIKAQYIEKQRLQLIDILTANGGEINLPSDISIETLYDLLKNSDLREKKLVINGATFNEKNYKKLQHLIKQGIVNELTLKDCFIDMYLRTINDFYLSNCLLPLKTICLQGKIDDNFYKIIQKYTKNQMLDHLKISDAIVSLDFLAQVLSTDGYNAKKIHSLSIDIRKIVLCESSIEDSSAYINNIKAGLRIYLREDLIKESFSLTGVGCGELIDEETLECLKQNQNKILNIHVDVINPSTGEHIYISKTSESSANDILSIQNNCSSEVSSTHYDKGKIIFETETDSNDQLKGTNDDLKIQPEIIGGSSVEYDS